MNLSIPVYFRIVHQNSRLKWHDNMVACPHQNSWRMILGPSKSRLDSNHLYIASCIPCLFFFMNLLYIITNSTELPYDSYIYFDLWLWIMLLVWCYDDLWLMTMSMNFGYVMIWFMTSMKIDFMVWWISKNLWQEV